MTCWPAGHPDRTPAAGVTIRACANTFCTHKQTSLNAGEITEWTFKEYHATCERLCEAFGRDRPVDDLVADDFRNCGRYRQSMGTSAIG